MAKNIEEIKAALASYGITGVKNVYYNPSYEQLFKDEMDPALTGYDKGVLTELDAVNVMTGIYTGRSPKDKYIVMDAKSKDTVWWTTEGYKNDNHPMSEEVWGKVKDLAKKQLSGKNLYVVDAFCGANKDTRMAVRFIMEVAWQAHFVLNMFIKPTAEELADFKPNFTVYTASKAKVDNYKELGLNSDTCVAFNVSSREQVILNTWYGGEMKKGMFSMMNYYLPLQGIAAMHCSANTDMKGENTAIFFGLSGTGKTTLSTDPKRLLIGDDEHGWDDEGVFNFEGGCYAKVINLDKESDRLQGQERDREHPRLLPHRAHREDREECASHLGWSCRQERHLPQRRRLRRVASCQHPDPRTVQVLLPERLHRQVGRHRAWHHRAYAHLQRLLRPSLP